MKKNKDQRDGKYIYSNTVLRTQGTLLKYSIGLWYLALLLFISEINTTFIWQLLLLFLFMSQDSELVCHHFQTENTHLKRLLCVLSLKTLCANGLTCVRRFQCVLAQKHQQNSGVFAVQCRDIHGKTQENQMTWCRQIYTRVLLMGLIVRQRILSHLEMFLFLSFDLSVLHSVVFVQNCDSPVTELNL